MVSGDSCGLPRRPAFRWRNFGAGSRASQSALTLKKRKLKTLLAD